MSHRQSQWILAEMPDMARALEYDMPAILMRMLLQRGVEVDEIEHFLNPRLRQLGDPFLLPDIRLAVERILHAVDEGQEVCVYGDYDVDGITSVTLLVSLLKAYTASVRSFIPRRGPEGYGLSEPGLERCMREGPKPSLLITVDCGSSSAHEIKALGEDGVDVIVVDHHELPPAGKPDCVAVINPKGAEGDAAQWDYLCAAGVVFKLMHALLMTRPVEGFDLKEHLDLVAMATVSDIVPLVKENRLLVRHGLRCLEKSKHPGIRALMKAAHVKGPVTSADVGFRIGPRINAAGRMDQPEDALATLTAESDQEAQQLAGLLDEHNRARQEQEQRINEDAIRHVENKCDPSDPVIVLGSRGWNPGVVGIVASRMMRRYHKPTFVIAIDEHGVGKGSGRSIRGVSLMEAINANRDCLLAGGGHAMAAGISLEEGKIEDFRKGFATFVAEHICEEDLIPKLHIDAEISFAELSLDFLDRYELLQPFGAANPEPVFLSQGVYLTEPPRKLKNQHLKLSLKQNEHWHDAMFFGAGERELPGLEEPWDIAFTINRNVFRGRTSLQIIIRDVRPSRQDQ